MLNRRKLIAGALATISASVVTTAANAEDKAYAAKLAAAYKKAMKRAKPGMGAGTRG